MFLYFVKWVHIEAGWYLWKSFAVVADGFAHFAAYGWVSGHGHKQLLINAMDVVDGCIHVRGPSSFEARVHGVRELLKPLLLLLDFVEGLFFQVERDVFLCELFRHPRHLGLLVQVVVIRKSRRGWELDLPRNLVVRASGS